MSGTTPPPRARGGASLPSSDTPAVSPGGMPEVDGRPPAPAPVHGGGGTDLLPVIVLFVIVALCLAAWLLFPWIQDFVSRQDCVATGRTNC